MLDLLPLSPGSAEVRDTDYLIFAPRFEEVIRRRIPTARQVRLLSCGALRRVPDRRLDADTMKLVGRVCATGTPERTGADTLLLPLPGTEEDRYIALVTGVDPVVVRGASPDWLDDLTASAGAEFALIKQAGTDPLSSLYQGHLLPEALRRDDGAADIHVVLVELLPRARTPKEAFAHVKSAARSLQEINRHTFPLFHLGQSVFAVVVDRKPRASLKPYCLALLTFLKRKGFRRVHCGSSSMAIERSADRLSGPLENVVIGEAWSALHTACRRGPFAFCDFDILANPDHFPLKALPRPALIRAQKQWASGEHYSLVLFKPDYLPMTRCEEPVRSALGGSDIVSGENGFLVLRQGRSAADTLEWALAKIRHIKETWGGSYSLSAGVSSYPFRDYSKTEILRNCQKALIHAGFFGPGSGVVFDALSLNISGDLYFGEGDLAGAVREYRRGLQLDETDTNLLNSLGVAYALMNRTTAAQTAFRRVLDIDPHNFMAHYNVGLGEQAAGRHGEALKNLAGALAAFNAEDKEEAGVIQDLSFQYGVALYHTGAFRQCAEVLEKWYENQPDDRSSGKGCRFIGLSYYNLGRPDKASTWLQRGLAFDEFDAESLSLLGEIYLKGGEGNEIALRLCEKSVEIDGANRVFLLRYARALGACGHFKRALEQLRSCGRSAKIRPEVWFELALVYRAMGNRKRAGYYLKKLAEGRGVPESLREKAVQILK